MLGRGYLHYSDGPARGPERNATPPNAENFIASDANQCVIVFESEDAEAWHRGQNRENEAMMLEDHRAKQQNYRNL